MLEGLIETSYTKADNSPVVATDTSMSNSLIFEAILTSSVKNTVNVYAKTSPHVLDPPAFALDLGLHFVNKYEHISKAFIDITSHRWSRIKVGGKDHKWSFVRDGDEKGTVECVVDGSAGEENVTASLKCGLKDLLGESEIMDVD